LEANRPHIGAGPGLPETGSWYPGAVPEHFDRFGKSYAVVETGEAAARVRLPKSGQVIDRTPQKQEAYYRALLAFAAKHPIRFVVTFIHRDYDAVVEDQRHDARGVPRLAELRPAGRRRQTPAGVRVWRQYFEMPPNEPSG
jgi:hypothetical protein